MVEHRLSEEDRTCDTYGAMIGDWQRGAPEPEDGVGLVLDPGGCVLHLRLQAVRSGNRRRKSPENTQTADALPGQLCLPGGGGLHLYCLQQEFQRQGLKLSQKAMAKASDILAAAGV